VPELLAAELPVSDDGKLWRRGILALQLCPRLLERRLKHDIGERGQVVGQPLDRQPTVEVLDQQAKRLRLLKVPQGVDLAFRVTVVGRELSCELGAPILPTGLGKQRAAVQKLVEQNRMPGQVLRGPRAGAEQMGEARKHWWVLDQKCEIGAASADRLEQHEQSDENFLRLPGLPRHA